jgi:hypothetical protein
VTGSGYSPVVDSCEYFCEPPGTMKGMEFLGELSYYQLIKKDLTP